MRSGGGGGGGGLTTVVKFALPTEVCGKAFSDSSSMAIANLSRVAGYATWSLRQFADGNWGLILQSEKGWQVVQDFSKVNQY